MKINEKCKELLETNIQGVHPLVVVCCDDSFLEFAYQNLCSDDNQRKKPCSVFFINASTTNSINPSLFSNLVSENCPKNININRWYFIGIGKGATLGWSFLSLCPRTFAGAVLAGGAPNDFVPSHLINLPLQVLGNSKDLYMATYSITYLGGTSCHLYNMTEQQVFSSSILTELFETKLSSRLFPRLIQPGLWNIESGHIDSFYLVEGKDKAFVIDTGMGSVPVKPFISKLTRLPFSLGITHAHIDHMLHADEFSQVFICEKDIPLVYDMVESKTNKTYDRSSFILLKEGDCIQLGGNVSLRVIEVPGHTPGSIAFIDDKHGCIFSGDAFGSGQGVLLSLQHASSISQYLQMLESFVYKTKDIKNYILYGGHLTQAQNWEYINKDNHPLCFPVISDMIRLCQLLLENSPIIFRERFISRDEPGKQGWKVSYRSAGMWIWKTQIC